MKNFIIITGLITSLSAYRLERRQDGDKVFLYEDIQYGGKKWEVTPRIFCFKLNDEMRNQASSAQWEVKNANNFQVAFYTDDNCQQNKKTWQANTPKNGQPSNFVIDGINDAVKSINLIQQD